MVNPTGSSPGELSNSAAANNASSGLRLQAASPSTTQFLAENAGKQLEARVINVLIRETSATPGSSFDTRVASQSAPAAGKQAAVRTDNPANPNTANAPPSSNPAPAAGSSTNAASAQLANAQYLVTLLVGNQQLALLSSAAPRAGQYLQLAVSNSQQVQVLSASQLAQTPASGLPSSSAAVPANAQVAPGSSGVASTANNQNAQSVDARLAGNPQSPLSAQNPLAAQSPLSAQSLLSAQRPLTGQRQAAAQNKPPASELIGVSLRDILPRQTPRANLQSTLAALLQSAGDLANRFAAKTGSPASTAGQTGFTAANSVSGPVSGASPGTPTGQASLAVGIAALGTASNLSKVVPAIRSAAQTLAASIPTLQQLQTPDGVKRALQDSGAFYERKLGLAAGALRSRTSADGGAAPVVKTTDESTIRSTANLSIDAIARLEVDTAKQRDYKHALLQLLGTLQSSLRTGNKTTAAVAEPETPFLLGGEIARVAETIAQPGGGQRSADSDALMQLLRFALGASSRLQTQQLLAVGSQIVSQADPAINQSLNLEIPLWLDQRLAIIDLQVERERKNKAAKLQETTWHVRLRFDLEELGELTALATLHKTRMAAVLWASEAALADRVEQELLEVSEQLLLLGLDVQSLQCRTGEPPPSSDRSAVNLLQSNLLDTRS